jgi:hypothetical protein
LSIFEDAELLSAVDGLTAERAADLIGRLEGLKARAWRKLIAPAPASTEPDHEITQQEAARLRPALGLKTIRYLTRTGRVSSVPRGKSRLVRLSDLDAYVARCRDQGVPLGRILAR